MRLLSFFVAIGFFFVGHNLLGANQPQSTLFTNVRVWDGLSESLVAADVLVSGNVIREVSEEGLAVVASTDMRIIDGGGRTLMPGLIDSHVHLTHTFVIGGVSAFEGTTWEEIGAGAVAAAEEYLMNGFTTVRDMGGMGTGVKRAIDRGLIEGPRIYSAGAYISQSSGHADFRLRSQPGRNMSGGIPFSNLERLNITRLADGVPEMLNAVRDNFAEGAAYIKIHAGGGVSSQRDPLHTVQYTPAELEAADQAVRNWDSYWTVHAYTDPTINQALDAGAACIDHGHMMSEPTMKRIVDEDIFLSINLSAMSPELLVHPLFSNASTPAGIKARQFMAGSEGFKDMVKAHKPKYVFNSDLVFSSPTYFRQHLDHEKYIAGHWFGNHYALLGMTSTAGELAQMTGRNNPYPLELGVIRPGAYADILLVDGNPLEDLSAIGADGRWFEAAPRTRNVESIRLIMKDGEIFKNTL